MKHVEDFYDNFSELQTITGINKRHLSIHKWCVKFGLTPKSKVLEIGCGIGTYTELLAKYCIEGNIDAYDISEKSIQIARERLKKYSNVRLAKGDVTQEKFDNEFDLIILPDVLEHIPIENHPQLFESLANSVTKDGSIIIHIPNPDYLQWCHENKPELLQIIDQPLYTNLLTENIYNNNLSIHYLKTYSVWIDNYDYQIIVLKKNSKKEYNLIVPPKPSLGKRIVNKVKQIKK